MLVGESGTGKVEAKGEMMLARGRSCGTCGCVADCCCLEALPSRISLQVLRGGVCCGARLGKEECGEMGEGAGEEGEEG